MFLPKTFGGKNAILSESSLNFSLIKANIGRFFGEKKLLPSHWAILHSSEKSRPILSNIDQLAKLRPIRSH
jgi:hypothetical protein